MMHALRELVGACQQAGVEVMLLKGAALNATLYDRPHDRPMRDLDIMVRPADADVALAALAEVGARPWRPLLREDYFPRYYHHLELRLGGLWPIVVELHVRPLRPLRCQATVPDEALWADAQPVSLGGGVTARVPGAEHQFLHLAAHLGLDGGQDPKWASDLSRLLMSVGGELHWDSLLADVRRWRLEAAVRRGVELAEQQVGPLPVPVGLRRMRGGWRDRLLLQTAPHDAKSPVAHVLGSLATCPDLRLSAGFLGAALLPGRRHMLDWYGREHFAWLAVAHAQRLLGPVTGLMRRLLPQRLKLERGETGNLQVVARVHLNPGTVVGHAVVEQDDQGYAQPPTYGPMRHLLLDPMPNVRVDGRRLVAVRQIRRGDPISLAPRWPATAGDPPLESKPPQTTAPAALRLAA
jgi:hypothetical protein